MTKATESGRLIIVRLVGGLGNQLFQLQYGKILQSEIGGRLHIEESFLNKSSKTHESLAAVSMIETIPKIQLSWTDLKVRRPIERLFHKLKIRAPNWISPKYIFDNSRVDASAMPIVIVDGFWQKTEYLNEDFLTNIRGDVRSREVASAGNLRVCVHVRRGDYLTNKKFLIKQQTTIPLSYYVRACEHFDKTLNNPKFEVYSDDEAWVSDVFKGISNVSIITSTSLAPLDLLARMASYQNYVIANSTLSWWAAVLSFADNKRVVIPKIWGKRITSECYRLPGWLAL